MNYSRILTVTQVTTYIKSLFEGDRHLGRIMVRGEISNFKSHYPSGHFYFTLKDDRALLRAMMFKAHASSVRFTPENGMAIIASGEISVYERDGQYQLYCTDMLPEGIGALALAFEQRKAKLEAQGLFDPAHKKTLPAFPRRIAVVTSQTGAAVEDILNILHRRYPVVQVLLCPVQVQGEDAPPMIADALHRVNVLGTADLILLARGGGSYEDLFAFNDERVANAIYESVIPVISAVGHETDFTIADFVADLRAPTPSAGAELAVPDASALIDGLTALSERMRLSVTQRVASSGVLLEALSQELASSSPMVQLHQSEERLRTLAQRMDTATHGKVTALSQTLAAHSGLLDTLSPLRVLQRGYAVAMNDDGHVIKNKDDVRSGDRLTIRLRDGVIDAQVL
ncbi:MAG: exodeoxyribonuclease VII large subunit [Acetanaerobacterium sp.]